LLKPQLAQAFRSVLTLGLFLLRRISPLSLLQSGWAIPLVQPMRQFRHSVCVLPALLSQLGSVICSALATRCDASYAVFSVIPRACAPHHC
jgi:hypothetical protein